MRTEDERVTNHDGSPVNEPNETTPLTEPEYVFLFCCFLLSSTLKSQKMRHFCSAFLQSTMSITMFHFTSSMLPLFCNFYSPLCLLMDENKAYHTEKASYRM